MGGVDVDGRTNERSAFLTRRLEARTNRPTFIGRPARSARPSRTRRTREKKIELDALFDLENSNGCANVVQADTRPLGRPREHSERAVG